MRPSRLILLLLAIAAGGAAVSAHDIPVDILIQAYVKPEAGHLRLLVRVPLSAMRDVNFPLHGQNLLNLPAPGALLREGAETWLTSAIALEENGTQLPKPSILAVRVSLPSDRSFASYDDALAHVTGAPLAPSTEIVWNQALLDVLFDYPIVSDRSLFSIDPTLARLGLRVVTTMRFLPPGGAVRAFEWTGDPGLVRLDPNGFQAAAQFVNLGFRHILDGTDHLLFLLCLVIPFRRFRQLVVIVTSFTVAHSVTLIASAFDLMPGALWFAPLVETLIAVSIVYMALDNIVGAIHARRRLLLTFAFGLVHGFGFSFALRETLQFAGSHLLTSLFAFNVGIELGQLLVLIVLVPLLTAVFRWVVAERIGTIILSALVAHTAWHWTAERAERLRQYSWPALDAATAARGIRWLMAIVLLSGLVWLWRGRGPRTADRRTGD
jgi:hypothetical protein